MLVCEHVGANAGWERANAVNLDAVVEDGDGDVRARVAHVAVDDGVDDDLAQRVGRHRQPVLAIDGARWEARRQWQRLVEPRDRLADHRERVEVLLLVVNDVARDLRAPKAPELEQRLRVVWQERGSVEHLRGLGDVPVDAQAKPVEDVADVHARAGREPALLDGGRSRAEDLLAVEVFEAHAHRGLVLPAVPTVVAVEKQARVLVLRHHQGVRDLLADEPSVGPNADQRLAAVAVQEGAQCFTGALELGG